MKGEPIRLFRRPSGQRARNRNISRYQQEIETSADVVLRPMTSSAHHQHQHYWSWGEVAPILDWIYLYRVPLQMIRDWNEDFLAIKLMNPYEDDIKDLSILTFIKQGWEGSGSANILNTKIRPPQLPPSLHFVKCQKVDLGVYSHECRCNVMPEWCLNIFIGRGCTHKTLPFNSYHSIFSSTWPIFFHLIKKPPLQTDDVRHFPLSAPPERQFRHISHCANACQLYGL